MKQGIQTWHRAAGFFVFAVDAGRYTTRQISTIRKGRKGDRTMNIKRLSVVAILLTVLGGPVSAADWTKIRRISQVAACAASMIDAGSSLHPGIAETNRILGAGQPSGLRIVGIKVGTCAGQFIFAEWRTHKHPDMRSTELPGAIVAWEQTGLFSILAARNLRAAGVVAQ